MKLINFFPTKNDYLFLIILIITSISTYAQVGIGTVNPDPSSLLHLESSNSGFLPPKVSLTDLNDISTISSPAEGLIIYNPASNDCNLPAGLYIFDSSTWQRISYSGAVMSLTRIVRDEVGVGNVTFDTYSSTNSFGNYTSLFNNVDDTGGSSFHSNRSGSPAGDWGFGITLPNKYFIKPNLL